MFLSWCYGGHSACCATRKIQPAIMSTLIESPTLWGLVLWGWRYVFALWVCYMLVHVRGWACVCAAYIDIPLAAEAKANVFRESASPQPARCARGSEERDRAMTCSKGSKGARHKYSGKETDSKNIQMQRRCRDKHRERKALQTVQRKREYILRGDEEKNTFGNWNCSDVFEGLYDGLCPLFSGREAYGQRNKWTQREWWMQGQAEVSKQSKLGVLRFTQGQWVHDNTKE